MDVRVQAKEGLEISIAWMACFCQFLRSSIMGKREQGILREQGLR